MISLPYFEKYSCRTLFLWDCKSNFLGMKCSKKQTFFTFFFAQNDHNFFMLQIVQKDERIATQQVMP